MKVIINHYPYKRMPMGMIYLNLGGAYTLLKKCVELGTPGNRIIVHEEMERINKLKVFFETEINDEEAKNSLVCLTWKKEIIAIFAETDIIIKNYLAQKDRLKLCDSN